MGTLDQTNTMSEIDALGWPMSKLGEAIEALARTSGLSPRAVEIPTPPEPLEQESGEAIGRWIEATAGWLGLEADPVESPYAEVDRLVRRAGTALLRLPGRYAHRFLALLGSRRRRVEVLGPDLAVHRIRPEVICAALSQGLEAPFLAEVERLLDEAGIRARPRARARSAILRERLSSMRIRGCWILRTPPGASFWRQMRQGRRLVNLVGVYVVQYALWLLSWWMVGRGALQGRFDRGWLLAWTLLLLTLVPLRMLATWLQGRLAIGAGGLLKRRLLYGALRLEPDEIRQQGIGQLFGRVLESEAVESLALSGGFLGLFAAIELVMAGAVLGVGAGGGFHTFQLFVWVMLAFLMGWRYFRHRRRWTGARLDMTNDLVERMVGHRTRLAQQVPERWYDGEDQALEYYLELSKGMDRTGARLMALMPRGWLIVGLLGLAPAFVSGRSSTAALAISLGGILLAYRALVRLTAGLSHLAGAAIAWERVASIFRAAARPEAVGSPNFALVPNPHLRRCENGKPILEAHDIVFRYRDRAEPVLRGCNLRVCAGDRLLLEGPSGGGKSTLASLLIGLRTPESGLVLLGGLDRRTLGSEGWRRVVAAPQFHENHVLTETFAFNLLMGRDWPPRPEDVGEAEAICRELGLEDLLKRMPAGLLQMVGDTGWRLSHGERSRLYMARALLQGAEVVILDESFAALDPENLHRALRCALERAPTLLVIAQP